MGRRLDALEARTAPGAGDFPDWPIGEQVDGVRESLAVHRAGGTVQIATDREIHLMGLLCALWELSELSGDLPETTGEPGVGEHRFPSGVVASWEDRGDGTMEVSASGLVRIEDLPDGVREHFRRMDPAEQPARERWLYEDRHRAREHRARVRELADRGEGRR